MKSIVHNIHFIVSSLYSFIGHLSGSLMVRDLGREVLSVENKRAADPD